MANKKKALHADARRELAEKQAKVLRQIHPDWTLQQINDAAYRHADKAIKSGQARVS